jgi:hypothetical protein
MLCFFNRLKNARISLTDIPPPPPPVKCIPSGKSEWFQSCVSELNDESVVVLRMDDAEKDPGYPSIKFFLDVLYFTQHVIYVFNLLLHFAERQSRFNVDAF